MHGLVPVCLTIPAEALKVSTHASQPTPIMTFCTQCGQPIAPGTRFCTGCGAAQTQGAPAAPQPVALVQGRSARPFLLVLVGILALIGAGIGGMVYAGRQASEKVTNLARAVSQPAADPNVARGVTPQPPDASVLNNLGGLLGDDEGDPVEGISSKDPIVPCTAAPFPSQGAARIPLQPGTVITLAWGINSGDVESRESIASIDPASITFSATTGAYLNDNGQNERADSSTHTVCNADFATANNYATVVGSSQPQLIHELTRARLSDKTFQEIRSSGKTNLVYYELTEAGLDNWKPTREGGLLTRLEPEDVAYPLIVNDQRVTVPAIHLAGVMASVGKDPRPKKDRPLHADTDVYLIDDPLDPLVLMLKLKDPALHNNRFRVEVTKIEYPVPHPVNLVEKQLTEQKRAVTYGIYFDFNKDTIKPESEPVLKEIVQAMTDHPDWKLTVEGHTDNIGGDAYNLDLSKRRAAAVKDALVTRYHLAADRLSTNGFGSSRPVETNDTLEGRARNRRVELTRE
jgi:outer membrane protein OmpA-like peptidoglycan-associated protein